VREKREREREDVTPRVRKRELNWSQHTYSFYTRREVHSFSERKRSFASKRERERDKRTFLFLLLLLPPVLTFVRVKSTTRVLSYNRPRLKAAQNNDKLVFSGIINTHTRVKLDPR